MEFENEYNNHDEERNRTIYYGMDARWNIYVTAVSGWYESFFKCRHDSVATLQLHVVVVGVFLFSWAGFLDFAFFVTLVWF